MAKLRQACCFLASGGLAFMVDAGTLMALHELGIPLVIGRAISIGLAMIAAWWLNRTFTFALKTPPTWQEFFGYAFLAAGVALINYGLFVLLIITNLVSQPLLATIVATLASMSLSFMGMKFGVFKNQ